MTFSEINERSYGVVPLMMLDGEPMVFIVQHRSGAWLLPKGHAEAGETARQAAERELAEETGLAVDRWLDHEPFIEHYSFWRGEKRIYKEVLYFPAVVKGTVCLQREEVQEGRWEPISCAMSSVTFPEMRRITKQVYEWLLTSSNLRGLGPFVNNP